MLYVRSFDHGSYGAAVQFDLAALLQEFLEPTASTLKSSLLMLRHLCGMRSQVVPMFVSIHTHVYTYIYISHFNNAE